MAYGAYMCWKTGCGSTAYKSSKFCKDHTEAADKRRAKKEADSMDAITHNSGGQTK